MSVSSMFGGTRSGITLPAARVLNTSTYIIASTVASTDYTFNVGIATANNHTLKNNTGKTLTVDVWGGWNGKDSSGGNIYTAIVKSTDNGVTWTPVPGTIRYTGTINNNYFDGHMTEGTVELEDGDMVAIGWKGLSASTLTYYTNWIQCKSRDGNNNPPLQALCSSYTHDGVYNTGTTFRYNYLPIVPNTINSPENVGSSGGNTARPINNTGVAQNVMGFVHMSVGQWNGTNSTTIYYRSIMSSGSNEGCSARAQSDGSPSYYTKVIMPIAGSLNNGGYIQMEGANQTSSARGVLSYCYQQYYTSQET